MKQAMVRLYASLVEYMLLALLYVKDTAGTRATEIVFDNAVSNWYKPKYSNEGYHKVVALVRNMLDTRPMSSFGEIDDAIKTTQESLATYNSPVSFRDSDLIELIVKTLQLPHARAALSGKALEQLKRAILLPDERAKLNEIIEAKELACIGCGRRLQRGEMMMYAGDGQFFCHNCEIPNIVACSKCKEGVIELPDKLYKAYGKSKICDVCSGVSKDKPEVDAPAVIGAGQVPSVTFATERENPFFYTAVATPRPAGPPTTAAQLRVGRQLDRERDRTENVAFRTYWNSGPLTAVGNQPPALNRPEPEGEEERG